MAKNTNKKYSRNITDVVLPITGRAPSGSNEILNNNSIKTIIKGFMLKLGLLTSEISISKNCIGQIQIKFLYYPLASKNFQTKFDQNLITIIQTLKNILSLKNPNNTFKFILIKAQNKFADPNLLADYINLKSIKNPSRIKYLSKYLLRSYKSLKRDSIRNRFSKTTKKNTHKKHDSIIIKCKNYR
jgi:hypothetical protein